MNVAFAPKTFGPPLNSSRTCKEFWKPIAGGCHLCRDIARIVADAGFAAQTTETMYLPNTPPWAGFNTWGSAVAR